MSAIYNLEPPTKGRLILHTTHGPLQVDLWSAEAPVVCRNLIQHALNSYYNDLPFHRIIPNVLAQTGDPTKTGTGGDAAIGNPAGYARELHGRLKFRRRGICAMVCDDSGLARSQFFITLAAADWLDGQHSIFGCVQGNTIYNLLNLAASGVDGFDGDAPRVKRVEVVENPFPKIVATAKAKPAEDGLEEGKPTAKRGIRNTARLSFAESDSDEEVPRPKVAKRRRSRFAQADDAHDSAKAPSVKPDANAADKSAAEHVKRPAPEQDNVVREANEEFERLKAELLGESPKLPESARPPDETDAVADALAKASTSDDGEGAARGANGLVAKRRRKPDETETLRRLKAFESRIVKSRRGAKKDATGKSPGAWFARGLRLATQVMEEEEYEVHFAAPKKTGGRRR